MNLSEIAADIGLTTDEIIDLDLETEIAAELIDRGIAATPENVAAVATHIGE